MRGRAAAASLLRGCGQLLAPALPVHPLASLQGRALLRGLMCLLMAVVSIVTFFHHVLQKSMNTPLCGGRSLLPVLKVQKALISTFYRLKFSCSVIRRRQISVLHENC